MNSIFFYNTSIGRIGIADNGEAITRLFFAGRNGNAEPGQTGKGAIAEEMTGATDTAVKDATGGEKVNVTDSAGYDSIDRGFAVAETALIKKAAVQLREYLDGKRKTFDVPIELNGTSFQRAVWNALTGIPYGETRSYGEIAKLIGRPKACRAVGMANNRNPVAVFVPCHRVIGANGKLVGYGGGMDIKERLLHLEGVCW